MGGVSSSQRIAESVALTRLCGEEQIDQDTLWDEIIEKWVRASFSHTQPFEKLQRISSTDVWNGMKPHWGNIGKFASRTRNIGRFLEAVVERLETLLTGMGSHSQPIKENEKLESDVCCGIYVLRWLLLGVLPTANFVRMRSILGSSEVTDASFFPFSPVDSFVVQIVAFLTLPRNIIQHHKNLQREILLFCTTGLLTLLFVAPSQEEPEVACAAFQIVGKERTAVEIEKDGESKTEVTEKQMVTDEIEHDEEEEQDTSVDDPIHSERESPKRHMFLESFLNLPAEMSFSLSLSLLREYCNWDILWAESRGVSVWWNRITRVVGRIASVPKEFVKLVSMVYGDSADESVLSSTEELSGVLLIILSYRWGPGDIERNGFLQAMCDATMNWDEGSWTLPWRTPLLKANDDIDEDEDMNSESYGGLKKEKNWKNEAENDVHYPGGSLKRVFSESSASLDHDVEGMFDAAANAASSETQTAEPSDIDGIKGQSSAKLEEKERIICEYSGAYEGTAAADGLTSVVHPATHGPYCAMPFARILDALSGGIENDTSVLLLYLLMQRNRTFLSYMLARTDDDHCIVPIVRVLYERATHKGGKHSPARGGNGFIEANLYNRLYVPLILLLIVSEDTQFTSFMFSRSGIHASWFEEFVLEDVSLGSLVVSVLIQCIRYSSDSYFISNCFAVLINMAPYFIGIPFRVGYSLLHLMDLICVRFLRIRKTNHQRDGVDLLFPEGSPTRAQNDSATEEGRMDEEIYLGFLRNSLEVVNLCLRQNLSHNLELLYAVLYYENVLERMQEIEELSDILGPMERLVDHFNKKIRTYERAFQTSDEVLSELQRACMSWDPIRIWGEYYAQLTHFRYEEDENASDFFDPFVWGIVIHSIDLPWHAFGDCLRPFRVLPPESDDNEDGGDDDDIDA